MDLYFCKIKIKAHVQFINITLQPPNIVEERKRLAEQLDVMRKAQQLIKRDPE